MKISELRKKQEEAKQKFALKEQHDRIDVATMTVPFESKDNTVEISLLLPSIGDIKFFEAGPNGEAFYKRSFVRVDDRTIFIPLDRKHPVREWCWRRFERTKDTSEARILPDEIYYVVAYVHDDKKRSENASTVQVLRLSRTTFRSLMEELDEFEKSGNGSAAGIFDVAKATITYKVRRGSVFGDYTVIVDDEPVNLVEKDSDLKNILSLCEKVVGNYNKAVKGEILNPDPIKSTEDFIRLVGTVEWNKYAPDDLKITNPREIKRIVAEALGAPTAVIEKVNVSEEKTTSEVLDGDDIPWDDDDKKEASSDNDDIDLDDIDDLVNSKLGV